MSASTHAHGGLYGKVPNVSDFVTRRLPSSFVRVWDAWLTRAIAASRAELGDSWTQAYLSSPPWRFALDPGLAGPEGWIGVLASSIDRFQRCFPVTMAIPLPPGIRLADIDGDIDAQTPKLESIALRMISGALAPDAATQELDLLAPELIAGALAPRRLAHPTGARLRVGGRGISVAMTLGQLTGLRGESPGASFWWRDGWNGTPPVALGAAGLPSSALFAAMLDGRWRVHGWAESDA